MLNLTFVKFYIKIFTAGDKMALPAIRGVVGALRSYVLPHSPVGKALHASASSVSSIALRRLEEGYYSREPRPSYLLCPAVIAGMYLIIDPVRTARETHPVCRFLESDLSSKVRAMYEALKGVKWTTETGECITPEDRDYLADYESQVGAYDTLIAEKKQKQRVTQNQVLRYELLREVSQLSIKRSELANTTASKRQELERAYSRCVLDNQNKIRAQHQVANKAYEKVKLERLKLHRSMEDYWRLVDRSLLPSNSLFMDPKVIKASSAVINLLQYIYAEPGTYQAPLGFRQSDEKTGDTYADIKFEHIPPINASIVFARYLLIITLLVGMLEADYFTSDPYNTLYPPIRHFIHDCRENFGIIYQGTTEIEKLREIKDFLYNLTK